MAGECFVITIIMLAIVLMFVRAKRKRWAVAAAPMCILPAINSIVSYVCTKFLHISIDLNFALIIIIIGIMISCIWVGICAMLIAGKKSRVTYISVGFLFNILLGLILVNHYMSVL